MNSTYQTVLRLAEEVLAEDEGSDPFSTKSPVQLLERLDLHLKAEGRPIEEVLKNMKGVIRHTPHTSGHRFFNQLFAGRIPIATAAEWMAGLTNVSMYTYKVAGPMILAEREVARRMCELAGFPEGDGISMPGGSIANLVGMLCGRHQAVPEFKDEGADGRRLTFYLSTEGHYSVIKNAGVLGIGRNNVRLIDVDEQGRMRPDRLAEAIARDVAEGAVPCAVIATAGTTVMGAFDPIREIAAVTERHQVWLHVDGAFGGTMLLHPEHRKMLDGVELADSLTWDAHKAMGMPLMCSMLLTRKPETLNDNLNEAADYLFQSDDDLVNPGTRSIQCGRANDTFKLWAAWQQLGDDGWAARIDQQVALSTYAARRVRSEEHLRLAIEPASTTVCFMVDGIDSPTLCEQLRVEGKALVGYGKVFEDNTVRLVTVNPDVTEADLDRLFDDILAIAAQHRKAMAAPSRC